MWTRNEIKGRGRAACKANYWKSVLVSFLLALLGTGMTYSMRSQTDIPEPEAPAEFPVEALQNIPVEAVIAAGGAAIIILIVCLLLRIFLFNPLKVGCYKFFKENAAYPGARIDTILTGFSQYGRTFLTLFLADLQIFLWALLLIIPGIVKAYSYRMVPYILTDEPGLAPEDVLSRSQKMMEGNKWDTFVYDLSFIGWFLLGAITFGLVDIFWTRPYKNNADAALYLKLKRSGSASEASSVNFNDFQ